MILKTSFIIHSDFWVQGAWHLFCYRTMVPACGSMVSVFFPKDLRPCTRYVTLGHCRDLWLRMCSHAHVPGHQSGLQERWLWIYIKSRLNCFFLKIRSVGFHQNNLHDSTTWYWNKLMPLLNIQHRQEPLRHWGLVSQQLLSCSL